ncbi:phage tail fiber protein [Streptomyces sp. BH104]|uniref:phage tail fiber protein n=1 Tax=Streptomyces sp. BH104 TaxID=3410407 RepID=UPI003BB6CE37
MDNLSNTAENLLMDWINGVGTPTRPTTQLKVALLTAVGDDATAGTEVTGGSYARKNLSVAASTGGATTNSADLLWTGMPACTIVGWEIWDNAGTPVRLWYGPLGASQTLPAGSEFKITAGGLALSIS